MTKEKKKNYPLVNFYHIDMKVRLLFPETSEEFFQIPVRYYAVVNVKEEDLHKISSQEDLQKFIDPKDGIRNTILDNFIEKNPHLKQKIDEAKLLVEDGPHIRKVTVDHVPSDKRQEYLQFIEESLPYVLLMDPLTEN
jgi:hypothetical protein